MPTPLAHRPRPHPRNQRPQGAVRRRFELFALEAWEDAHGNILEVNHGTVVTCHLEPDTRALDFQRTFDEFIEEELFWDHHLNNAPDQGEGDEDAE